MHRTLYLHGYHGFVPLMALMALFARVARSTNRSTPDHGDLEILATERYRRREFDIPRIWQAGGCEFGSLAGQLVESEPDLRPDLAAGYEQWLDLFRQGLRLMHDRGDLAPAADPDALADALLAALQGGLLLAQTLRRADPLRDSLQAAVAHLETFAATPAGSGT